MHAKNVLNNPHDIKAGPRTHQLRSETCQRVIVPVRDESERIRILFWNQVDNPARCDMLPVRG